MVERAYNHVHVCGKQCYPGRQEAQAAVSAIHKRGKAKGSTSVYYCNPCEAYHWGHNSANGKKRSKRKK